MIYTNLKRIREHQPCTDEIQARFDSARAAIAAQQGGAA